MNTIILSVVIVAAIGLIAGFGLSFASSIFAVPKDEKEEQIRECLPGANCGACGFSGCDGYAAALAKGETDKTNLCAPGGNDAAASIAKVLGLEAQSVAKTSAVVLCSGYSENAKEKLEYVGVKSCKAASMLYGGYKACQYGCLGFGDCMSVCQNDAIFICDGVARVDSNKCQACKRCVSACPKHLIQMLPADTPMSVVVCANHNKGAVARKQCSSGCIGCGMCRKVCEHDAIVIDNFLAHVDYTKCVGCGKCNEACPIKCIDLIKL